MKLYISADIEGTTGITRWEETENGHSRYPYFADQMTREVNAACLGALDAGCDEILVKDAHDSACNLIPRMLPEEVKLFRGWGSDPMGMCAGLDESFGGIFFTGYHSGAGMNTNPLAHTMNRQTSYVRINGLIAPELMLGGLCAAYMDVPVLLVTGDEGLCKWIHSISPCTETVAVSKGVGRGSISIHPDKALRLIREAAERAVRKDPRSMMFPLPASFRVEIGFKEHYKAKNAASYPGCVQKQPHTIYYEADDFMDVMKMLDWVL
jgi:D-amino peptidase